MGLLKLFKDWKELERKLRRSFTKRDKILQENKIDVIQLKEKIVSKLDIRLMIIDEVRAEIKRESRTPRTIARTSQRKRVDKKLDKIEIMQEIGSMLQKGLSTTEIYNVLVIQKAIIKKTCFYKYLKEVRKHIARTPRTNSANK